MWDDAAGYEAYVGHWSRALAPRFLAWLGLPRNLRWLDVACGTGAVTRAILANCGPAQVTGVDGSESYLEAARGDIHDARVRFEIGDARALPFPDASFDASVSGLALNFISADRTIPQQLRVTRPGGTVAAYVWDYAGGYEYARRFWDAALSVDARAANYDPGLNFDQLLGINNSGQVAGYFGDGSSIPEKGFTAVSPYAQANFTNENFPGSFSTEVTGINSLSSATTVGFYTTTSGGAGIGFVDQGGTFTSVSDPLATGGTFVLGVNNSKVIAGYYVNASGNDQGFTYNAVALTFAGVNLPSSFHAVQTVVTGINNGGLIVGYYTDNTGATHGFIDDAGAFTGYDDPSGTQTEFLGVNNLGQVVGSYVDASGETHGLLFDPGTDTFQTIDDPLASASAAFGIDGTTVNGINDSGQLVGFYSDGTNVSGFVTNAPTSTSPTPEPGSMTLLAAGLLGLVRNLRKRA